MDQTPPVAADGGSDPSARAAIVEWDWRWIAAALAGQGHAPVQTENSSAACAEDGDGKSSLWRQKWSGMRLVDTVVLDNSGEVDSWIFTAKTGQITSKKTSQKKAKVVERFAKFALANKRNTEGFVALVIHRDRSCQGKEEAARIVIDKAALEEALTNCENVPPALVGATLQCYLRPQNGSNSFLRARYRAKDLSVSIVRVSPLYSSVGIEAGGATQNVTSHESYPSDAGSDSASLQHETETVVSSLVAFLEARTPEGTGTTIDLCDADFVVDDNGELWLISLPRVTSALAEIVKPEGIATPINVREVPIKMHGTAASMPTLKTSPTQFAPWDGGGTPVGTASRQGVDSGDFPRTTDANDHGLTAEPGSDRPPHTSEKLPEIPKMLGARSTPGEHNKSGGYREKATPIIEKKGGVFIAAVRASALRGLCCWREGLSRRGNGSRTRDSPRWQIIERRYKGNLNGERGHAGDDVAITTPESTSSPESFGELSAARYKMTARSIFLAMATASFLRGDEPLRGSGEDSSEFGGEIGGTGLLAQRWKECDQQAQLKLAAANPQAYYEEVTVCGNCMEICRKLDCIRAAGFPDVRPTARPGTAGASEHDYEPPPRPTSEPSPDSIKQLEGEPRPGTAAAGSSGAAALAESRQELVNDYEPSNDKNSSGNAGSIASPSSTTSRSGPRKQNALDPDKARPTGPEEATTEKVDVANDHHTAAERSVSAVGKDVNGDKKTSASKRREKKATSNVMGRISGVYGGGGLKGSAKQTKSIHGASAGHRAKARSQSTSSREQSLPSVTALARFAIERERLAREMGMEEFAGPATLGVVNVGARSQGRGGSDNAESLRGVARTASGGGGGMEGNWMAREEEREKPERRSAGEILLEKLESVAEARSFQSGTPNREQASIATNGTWSPPGEETLPLNFPDSGGWNGTMGELSSTESAFLERTTRQALEGINIPGRTGDPLFGHSFEEGFQGGGGHSNGGMPEGNGGGGGAATISALRDRLAGIEAENSALRTRARHAEEERALESVKADKATKKLVQARTEFARAMCEKEEDHRRKELVLEERHSRELANKSQSSAEEMAKRPEEGTDGSSRNERGDTATGVGSGRSSKNLLGRLEQALKDMAEHQRHFADAKRTILAEKAQEVAAAELKGRRELQEARSLAAAMEDRASTLQEQVSEAAKQISTLKAREEEQCKRRKAAEEDADKSRKDINILRQTVQQSQSMDIADDSGGRRDGKSALAAVTATSEARIRTLNNKVEFLKAQLSSEQTLKAEVEAALAISRKRVFDAKDGARKQAAAAEKAREAAVEEAVGRVQRQMEESMSEAYRVQSKVQVLQDQLNDSLGDLSAARRREESLKAELAQTAAKLDDRTAELEKAQLRADDLAEARAADTESSADRAAREAVVRRLDNERQYLKSQLQSEITCKDELREALTTATRQLGEIKACIAKEFNAMVDWAEEQAQRTEEFQQELQNKSAAMGDLHAEKVAMEAELVAATRQLGLLKEGYTKARDNLRAEQSALETARTANRRLREQVNASSEELASLRKQQVEDTKRHSQSIVAAQTALDEADEVKRKQAVDQQLQLRQQLLKTGEVQRQLMALQAHVTEKERKSDRNLAAERLGQGLHRWSKNRKAWAFYAMVNGVTMNTAEGDVRERTRRALREAGESARKTQDVAVEDARRAAEADAFQQLEEAEQSFAVERVALLEDADAAAAAAAEQEKVIETLSKSEAAFKGELEKLRRDVDGSAEMRAKVTNHREQMVRAAKEAEEKAQIRIQAVVLSTKASCEEAAQRAKDGSDERWRLVLREHLDKAKEEEEATREAISREHDAVLQETQQAFRVERDRLHEEAKALADAAVVGERERGVERQAQAREAGAAQAAASFEFTRQADRRAADEEWTVKLAAAADQAKLQEAAIRTQEEEARRRASMQAQMAREALEKELAAARERAVKLEGGKWQRASEEAEARAAADQAAAYERGMTDRGRRAEAEAIQLQQAAEKALEEVKQGARTTIEGMMERHSEELAAETRRMCEEEAIEREKAVERTKEEAKEQQTNAVAHARAAATAEARDRLERERAAAVEAARERERLVTEKVQDELRSARTAWAGERRELKQKHKRLEEAEEKAKEELLRAMVNSSQATQRARARWEEGQKAAMEKAAAQAVEDREKALEDARRAFKREKKRALVETQDAFAAQAETMAERLRKQSHDSLKQEEAAHANTTHQKEAIASELEEAMKTLKEREAAAFHAEADAKEQALRRSVQTWRLVATALERGRVYSRSVNELRKEAAERESAAESAAERQKQALSADIEELLQVAFDARRRFGDMQETLVNHKREVLIDHKVQSASLHKELDSLARDRDQLEEQRLILHREFRELESQAKEAEKEAHAHSRQSTIGPDGMVIPAVARKKRRLDEELEGLLEAMEAKRKTLVSVDNKLTALAEARSVKDEEMKGLERTLVQVLVEQQKKLLVLLTEAKQQDERLEDINNRTRAAREEARRRQAAAHRLRQELNGAGVGGG